MFEGRLNLEALQVRTLSAAILIFATLAILYYGGWPFILLLAVLAGWSLFEWIQMSIKLEKPQGYGAAVLGVLYVIGSMVCCYYIFSILGFYWAMIFLLMVWGSDSGAYFMGKLIGGPKMAPMISPNKTWSGFAGALVMPFIIGFLAMILFKGIDELSFIGPLMMAVAGLFVGVAGQGGDLLVSVLKRKAGVKDTGSLIPGHGGLLDRIDSMLLAAPVYLLLHYVGHG